MGKKKAFFAAYNNMCELSHDYVLLYLAQFILQFLKQMGIMIKVMV